MPRYDFASRSFALAVRVVRTTRSLSEPQCPRSLAAQLLKAGTSVGANIEEARSSITRRDLIAKHAIALREARETAYWCRLLVASGIGPQQELEQIGAEAAEFVAMLTAAIVKLRARERDKRH